MRIGEDFYCILAISHSCRLKLEELRLHLFVTFAACILLRELNKRRYNNFVFNSNSHALIELLSMVCILWTCLCNSRVIAILYRHTSIDYALFIPQMLHLNKVIPFAECKWRHWWDVWWFDEKVWKSSIQEEWPKVSKRWAWWWCRKLIV